MMSKAVFLDRDGVINEMIYYKDMGIIDSPFTVKQFRLLPSVGRAINLINRMKLKVIVVSNQPGIARGHFTEKTLALIDNKMKQELARSKAFLDAIYYCLHDPRGKDRRYKKLCNCRKPKSGLLMQGAKDLHVNLKESYMIGDDLIDIQAGQRVGCKTIFLGRMKCQLCKTMEDKRVFPDLIVPDLLEAVKKIQKMEEKNEDFY